MMMMMVIIIFLRDKLPGERSGETVYQLFSAT